MKTKIIVSLVGSLVGLVLFFVMLWFVVKPNDIKVPVVVEDGDAEINTIGTAFTLIDLHSVSALWSGSTMILVMVLLLVTGCCCKNKALKSVHSHLSVKLKDEFTALLSDADNDSSKKLDRIQESAVTLRQGQLESRTRHERARLEAQAMDEEEDRLDRMARERKSRLAERRRQEELHRQTDDYEDQGVAYMRHSGRGAEGGVQFTRGVEPYDYHVVVPAEQFQHQPQHQAMVHQPRGGVMRGRTSARYGVDVSHLSPEGQRIYQEMK